MNKFKETVEEFFDNDHEDGFYVAWFSGMHYVNNEIGNAFGFSACVFEYSEKDGMAEVNTPELPEWLDFDNKKKINFAMLEYSPDIEDFK